MDFISSNNINYSMRYMMVDNGISYSEVSVTGTVSLARTLFIVNVSLTRTP